MRVFLRILNYVLCTNPIYKCKNTHHMSIVNVCEISMRLVGGMVVKTDSQKAGWGQLLDCMYDYFVCKLIVTHNSISYIFWTLKSDKTCYWLNLLLLYWNLTETWSVVYIALTIGLEFVQVIASNYRCCIKRDNEFSGNIDLFHICERCIDI